MTTLATFAASVVAAVVPGVLIAPNNPAAVLGFAVVGICLAFASHDYLRPRRVTRHGLRL